MNESKDMWLWLFVVLLLWYIYREAVVWRRSNNYAQILRIMRGACKQLGELKQLTLDIEQRAKMDRIQDSLRQATHVAIHGGQNNLGRTTIGGDQEQQL